MAADMEGWLEAEIAAYRNDITQVIEFDVRRVSSIVYADVEFVSALAWKG